MYLFGVFLCCYSFGSFLYFAAWGQMFLWMIRMRVTLEGQHTRGWDGIQSLEICGLRGEEQLYQLWTTTQQTFRWEKLTVGCRLASCFFYHSWFTLVLLTHRYYYLKEMVFENVHLPRVGRYRWPYCELHGSKECQMHGLGYAWFSRGLGYMATLYLTSSRCQKEEVDLIHTVMLFLFCLLVHSET